MRRDLRCTSIFRIQNSEVSIQFAKNVMKNNEPNQKRNLLDQPPEVIRRWMRFRALSFGKRLSLRIARLRLTWQERERRKQLLATFGEVKKQAIVLEQTDFDGSKTLFNIALFILLIERDIDAAKVDAMTHPDVWKRQLALRVILLTVHEWDMGKVAGRRLNEVMQTAGISEAEQSELTQALRQIRKVQRKFAKAMGETRNLTIAHRDPNALGQYRAIRDLDMPHVIGLVGELYQAFQRFHAVFPQIMLQIGSIAGLLRQVQQKKV